ncbi:deleted in malignant brain tumors 1 protein-like [Conger conger]|nr:deleted in malignant brain tumors 1 protein-like [Conger conger]
MAYVSCSGSKSSLKQCESLGWGKHRCNHGEDAGVICSEVRLVGGTDLCSGRVEVHHGSSWGTVCDADFDQQDAEVVCRELGCGAPKELRGAAAFGQGEGQVWAEEIQCRGNESQINFCPTAASQNQPCSHGNDVSLVCSDSIRLVNGSSPCAGRVEVYRDGEWGRVCDRGWDLRDAVVVCRQLGCGDAVDALREAHFGPGSGTIWMGPVSCSGSESSLKQCGSQGWGKHRCNHGEDAGVICSETPQAVLTVSPHGRIYRGQAVSLSCEVSVPSAGWEYYWYKGDGSSGTALIASTAEGSYTLSAAALAHTGEYSCRAGRSNPVWYTEYSHPVYIQVTGRVMCGLGAAPLLLATIVLCVKWYRRPGPSTETAVRYTGGNVEIAI